MNIIEMKIHNYLVNSNPYRENNIELIYDEDTGESSIGCHVPGYDTKGEGHTLNLFTQFESLHNLIYEFILTEPSDLKNITPELMYKRFQVGRCELHCYLDPDLEFHLIFRWNKNQLIARNGNEESILVEKSYVVSNYVNSPEELIEYTKHYFNKLIAAL